MTDRHSDPVDGYWNLKLRGKIHTGGRLFADMSTEFSEGRSLWDGRSATTVLQRSGAHRPTNSHALAGTPSQFFSNSNGPSRDANPTVWTLHPPPDDFLVTVGGQGSRYATGHAVIRET